MGTLKKKLLFQKIYSTILLGFLWQLSVKTSSTIVLEFIWKLSLYSFGNIFRNSLVNSFSSSCKELLLQFLCDFSRQVHCILCLGYFYGNLFGYSSNNVFGNFFGFFTRFFFAITWELPHQLFQNLFLVNNSTIPLWTPSTFFLNPFCNFYENYQEKLFVKSSTTSIITLENSWAIIYFFGN